MVCLLLVGISFANAKQKCPSILDFSTTKLGSSDVVNFCDFAGKPVLVVNTASRCGYTPQFKGLEELHKIYKDRVVIVGFPSDDFKQEYIDENKISEVCQQNYGVTFTMLSLAKVKGEQANELYKKLAESTGEQPKWNFNKYLISADSKTVKHYPSKITPTMLKLELDKQL